LADKSDTIREAFRLQAGYCRDLGSPFTAGLCEIIGERLTPDYPVGARVLHWQGKPDAMNDSVPLRLAGALHALASRGTHPGLSEVYPPNPLPEKKTLWQQVRKVLIEEEDEILRWLGNPPQTNEVRRSAVLMAGLHVVAAETHFPLALYELGASGGLNLALDQYAYRLGKTEAGKANSSLRLMPEWKGASPPDAEVVIKRRRGVDLLPVDVSTEDGRERLMAYVWPDQTERLIRTREAIAIARSMPPKIDKADAADWVESVIHTTPEMGVVRVVMHSISFQYFPKESQERIQNHLALTGRHATREAPLAWLRMEGLAEKGVPITLTFWPEGTERVLAYANPHGQSINWM